MKRKHMRIAIVASSLQAGGAERQLSLLANAWAKAGEEIGLVLLSGPKDPVYFPLDPLVRVVHLDSVWNSRGIVKKFGNLARRASLLGEALRIFGPDLVIAVLPEAMIYSAISARRLRLPLILSQRNNPEDDSLPHRWRIMRHVAFRAADAIVFQTERARAAAPRAFGTKGVVAPNIVRPPGVEAVDHGATVIVAAGRLVREKGFDILLRAFAQVRRQRPDWRLTIYGEGPERPVLEALAEELGLDAAAVSLPGVSDFPLMWVRGASLFVLPSRTEGFPNVLCEAMAHGYPVVATDCRFGPADIIQPGVNGLLVPNYDPSSIAAAILSLIVQPNLRITMGDKARAVASLYSEDRVSELWLDLIRHIAR